MNNPLLLELSAWPWLERLSARERRHVTLATVPGPEWDRIARDGFNLLFLMGVWTRSAIGRELARSDPGMRREYDRALPGWTPEDVPGSPYCVQSYDPDPRMGGWPGLETARNELRGRGIGLILDFVPNHTGFDHSWVSEHPQRYVLGTDAEVQAASADFRRMQSVEGPVYVACARDPYFPPWRDVAQLNHFNPETRQAMRRVLRRLASHCDGVRCDMAMLALNDVFERTWRARLHGEWPRPADEFWPAATRSTPGLIYLAEVYWDLEGVLLDQGFTFAYDKRLLDALHAGNAAQRVRQLLVANHPPAAGLARFIENHDEPRSAAALVARMPAAATLAVTLPGMRFVFDGQQEGRRIRSPVQLGRWLDEPIDEQARTLYAALLKFGVQPLVRDGEWRVLESRTAGDETFADIVAYRWRTPTASAVIALNLGAAAAHAHIRLDRNLLPAGDALTFDDALTGIGYPRTRDALDRSGLYVRLERGGAHLFTIRTDN
ncbi:MAG: hypothetical protein V7647_3978 [Acidobacteriota bacterium]|jgi:hypothetical protein